MRDAYDTSKSLPIGKDMKHERFISTVVRFLSHLVRSFVTLEKF